MRKCLAGLIGLCALAWGPAAAAGAPSAGASFWHAGWAASPLDAHAIAMMIAPEVDTLRDSTVRQRIVVSRGGSAIRVRLSNEFSAAVLHIGAASVGVRSPAGAIRRLPLTFAGARSVVVGAGAPIVSDPLTVTVPDGAVLEISLYLPDTTKLTTLHPIGLQPLAIWSGDGTQADTPSATTDLAMKDVKTGTRFSPRLFVSEVDAMDRQPVRTVIAFGDSITDGYGSAPGLNHRWPDSLARRFARQHKPVSVVNQGISGNQVLADGAGVSALARFDRDVLALPGASAVILLEGINDIGFSGGFIPGLSRPDTISPAEIIAGYRQLIARAHARGLKAVGATMTPFAGSPAYTAAKEDVRQAINRWIRTGGAFDAVIDFDRALREPAHPERLQPAFDSGDHIHPSDAGYAAMAAAVDLSVF